MLKLFQDAAVQQHLNAQIELFQSFKYKDYKFPGMFLEHPTQWIVFILKNPWTPVRSVLRSLLDKLIRDRKTNCHNFKLVLDRIYDNIIDFEINIIEQIFDALNEVETNKYDSHSLKKLQEIKTANLTMSMNNIINSF